MGGPDPKFAKFMYYKATHLTSDIQADCNVQRKQIARTNLSEKKQTYKKKQMIKKHRKRQRNTHNTIYDININK